MRRTVAVRPEFTDFIPEKLAPDTLHISMRYATAAHLCCCGCGSRVVTPLSPTDWKLVFDGETVSLSPSIGNWGLKCQSHYWIEKNLVIVAPRWTRAQVEAGRANDGKAKRAYFDEAARPSVSLPSRGASRLVQWLSSWFGPR